MSHTNPGPLKTALRPSAAPLPAQSRAGAVLLLIVSAICIVAAPLAMPPGYSWLSHSISESAAQGLRHAWIARFGFMLFGLGVLWLAQVRRATWARGVYWMHLAFAVFMLGTAAFSHKPWLAGVPSDPVEDFLHSLTATGMGFAFAFGVMVRLLQRRKGEHLPKAIDLVAILAATLLTPIGGAVPGIAGLLQRLMFAVAYLWYGHEALFPKPEKPLHPR